MRKCYYIGMEMNLSFRMQYGFHGNYNFNEYEHFLLSLFDISGSIGMQTNF